ncbi:MAG TPA: hypothetical protein PKA53_00865 [Sphingobacterium sp.]|nr:hypothetical protein [Sphingobacterium sp.]
MRRNRKLLLAGISIILGLMLMRLAWFVISARWGAVVVITGSLLFLTGVVFFALIFFDRKNRF